MINDLSLFRGPPGVERAREIIERMGKQQIPTSPANYEIWTTHVAGVKPDLSREIEARLQRGEAFTDETNEELFERFFANTRLSIQMLETSETIARELDDTVSSLRGAGGQAGSYAKVLQEAASRFEGGVDSAEFRTIVEHLAVTTHEMVESNLKLAEQIEAQSRQVEELQTALQSVKVEALTDGLTGLANRRMFDETLRRRMNDAAADSSDLCVLVFDIDQFKRINEAWGHALGDQVLRYIASVMRAHAQGDVLAARFGGEEFALIMPRTNVNLAEALAARISRAVKSKRLSLKSTGDVIGEITVSIGIARFRDADQSGDLAARAEACMLAAKHGGRDRIVTDAQLDRQSAA
ncbi:GGDEF domain-containing protein [Terricaulis silvestris]|uniref:diguanylate cyclase n=1 Tax=Terricaulis silvestris TaxID=2686094 RepID=A0A6I6MRN5_9CAUL|nr:GGDEF domain-containing protein [Terricaulis silvestris]QGZ96821.1 putative diguanylate cyclase YdaM [Terricaulis silvestris]